MEVIIRETAQDAEKFAADLLAKRIKAKSNIVLGLATGRTMEHVYAYLQNSGLSFAQVRSFNLDEYIGLGPDHPGSFRHYMQERLFKHIDILSENTFLPDGNAQDIKTESMLYEKRIKDCGGIDVQLLGIGRTGHLGFNEPLSPFTSRTRDKVLTATTRTQNAPDFGNNIENVPFRSITMGVGTILDARELIMLATGEAKADIVAKAIEGPLTSMITASGMQLHPNCKVVLDQAAASRLEHKDYYDFIFAHDPEWADYQ